MPKLSDKKKAERHIGAAFDALDAGNGKKALEEIDRAIELTHGGDSAPWAVKSRLLYELGKHQEAEAAAWSSLSVDKMNHHAWISLGLINYYAHEFMKAAFFYKKAVEIDNDYAIYSMLAAAEEQFDPESAIKHAKKALELNPDWDEAEKILESAKAALKEE